MAGGGTAIRAGKAYVELYADDSKLVRGLKQAANKIHAFGTKISAVGQKFIMLGAAIAAPLAAASKMFASMGDSLDKMSTRMGVSVEFLSALGHAAAIGGTDLAAMETEVRRLQRAAYDASQGLKTQQEAFDALGISVRGADGQLKSTEQLFMQTATALSGVENNTKKAALASILFGRAGTQLLPMLKDGEAGLVGMMEEAKRLGLVLSTEDAAAAAQFTDVMTRLSSTLKVFMFRVGAALAPILEKTAEYLRENAQKMAAWVQAHQDAIVKIAKLAAGILAVGAALTVTGKAAMAFAAILAFMLANPVIAAVAALAAASIALGYAMAWATSDTANLCTAMADLRAQSDQQRASELDAIDRLGQLSEQQSLTAAEMAEAQSIITALENRYGALGIKINEATGALEGFAAGQALATEKMRAERAGELEREIAERQRNMSELEDEVASTGSDWTMTGGARADELVRKARTEGKAISAAIRELEKLREGPTREALTGQAPAAAPGFDAGEVDDEAAAFDAEMAKRITDLRIQGMEDEQAKAIALINERYDHELEKAIELNGNIEELERAHQAELANAEAERARKAEKIHADAMAEMQAQQERLFEERQAATLDLVDEIKRLEIETGGGTDLQKGMQLLEMDRQQALEKAAFEGTDPDLVKYLFDLKAQQLQAGQTMERVAPQGTYSAAAAELLGGRRGGPEQETAKNTRAIAEGVALLNRNVRHGQLLWGA